MESFEQKLKDAIAQRRPCNLSIGDAQEDLADSDNWGPERTIDGGLLTRVLLDDKAEFGPLDRPLEIIGARITGYVDLRAVTLSKPVFLIRCVFDGTVDCDDARLQTISFEQSRLTSLQTRRAKIEGSLMLRAAEFSGEVRLESATVTRDVDLTDAQLSEASSLLADRLTVQGSVYLRDRFHSRASVRLEGATIGTALDGSAGTFEPAQGPALVLNTTAIGGVCDLSKARLSSQGTALSADGTKIERYLSLAEVRASGMILLRSARIGGNLNMTGINLSNPNKVALDLGRTSVAGEAFISRRSDGARAEIRGRVVLLGTAIGGNLIMEDATLDAQDDPAQPQCAIAGDGLTVSGNLGLPYSTIRGWVMLRDLRVGGTLNMSATKIECAGAIALDLERSKIGGDVFIRQLTEGTKRELALIRGGLRMTAASVQGSLLIQDGAIDNQTKELLFNRLNVAGVFTFANIVCGTGTLSLANAKVFSLNDEHTRWPPSGSLRLNGFDYGSFGANAVTGWRQRLDWLRRFQPAEFNPQPYMTLVSVLRRTGHERDAKRIAIARHRDARSYMTWGNPRWLGSLLMEATCGHGYRPWLAAFWGAFFICVGAAIFNLDAGARIALKAPGAKAYEGEVPPGYPTFQPLLYSADIFLPIVNLQQKDYWTPNSEVAKGRLARFYLPLHILAGWFFTTLFVAGVSGLIRKE